MSNRRPAKKQPLSAAQRADAKAKNDAKAERRAERKEAERIAAQAAAAKRRNRRVFGTIAAVVIGALLIWGGVKLFSDDRPLVAPRNVDGFSVVVGQEDAPTTLTIYEDLQCPACANLEAQFGEQINTAIDAGAVKVEYRLVSFLDSASRNDYSSRAANALLATVDTAGVDAFKSLHDVLFANQPAERTRGADDDQLIELAVAAGAEEKAIRELVEVGTFVPWIRKATDQWSKDGHASTPVVLVNGEKLEDNSTLGQYLTVPDTEEPTDEPTEGSGDSKKQ